MSCQGGGVLEAALVHYKVFFALVVMFMVVVGFWVNTKHDLLGQKYVDKDKDKDKN